MVKIDELDRKIISILERNARESFAEVARKLKVSEGTVHFRVQKLRKSGVIKGFYTEIVPEKVGKGLTAIIGIKADPTRGREALDIVSKIDDVYEVYDVTGEYYAIVKVRTANVESLRALIDKMESIDGVTSTHTFVILRTVKEEKTVKL